MESSIQCFKNTIHHFHKQWNNFSPLIFWDIFIGRVNLHKHLGVYLSSSLDWSKPVDKVCLKANRKLSVLRTVKSLNRQTLDILYKLTVHSVIDHALPVYCSNLRQTEISGLENLQYRAAKLVTGTVKFTSREKLNLELGWESIQKQSDNFFIRYIYMKQGH